MDRRDFIRLGTGAALTGGRSATAQNGAPRAISLLSDPSDPVASAPAAQWAAGELEQVLTAAGFAVRRREQPAGASPGRSIVICGSSAPAAAAALKRAGIPAPSDPESVVLLPGGTPAGGSIVAASAGPRGLTYALLELADRVRSDADSAFRVEKPVVESPANQVRSIMRQFTSEPLDKPWYYDREMWDRYLTMLAANRYNRFHLAFGLGYDALQQVADSYFLFLYPFLLAVPGYDVKATNLPDAERDRNLEMLRFISEQTVARGIEFELGIWMHGYRYTNSPRARHIIEGITPENHAPYCRDALTAVLRACPAISSVTLRIHGESGIAEGSYDFWRTVFDGVKRCGRRVEIDLHAKGIDSTMIEGALATGMPVNVAPKYAAEHQGMPYHQAAIRDLEMPRAGRTGAGLMTLSEGARSFTRYGYADLLRDDRKYTVRHRLFSGTQRLLLWGDPQWGAAYSRSFRFSGSNGADLMEPLTCRGRRGTGVGSRSGYADSRLEPRWDWEKYEYWYRVWGRTMYNPETGPEVWERQFGRGSQAAALRSSLASASRILPIVTMSHLPSAACDAYWPEIYWNQPMAGEPRPNYYGDSPAPKTFQNVSPLDPQMFSRIGDFAGELLAGKRSGKYSPVEVAEWLEDLAERAENDLRAAGAFKQVELSRAAIDIGIQTVLGRFFAAKFRAGVLFAIFERTNDRRALEASLKAYRSARAQWAQVIDRTKGVYGADLSPSDRGSERGQWSDRLAAIDQDIANLESRLAGAVASEDQRVSAAIQAALERPRRDPATCTHKRPAGFAPNQAVPLEIAVDRRRKVTAARLFYRHVNQAERYEAVEMRGGNNSFQASIPAAYCDSPYALQYYFEFAEGPEKAWLYPGFSADLSNEPYFVLERRRPGRA